MPQAGLEPARPLGQQILSSLRIADFRIILTLRRLMGHCGAELASAESERVEARILDKAHHFNIECSLYVPFLIQAYLGF